MKRSRSMTDPDGQRDCGCANDKFCGCKGITTPLSSEKMADRMFEELPLSAYLDFTAREETRAYILECLVKASQEAYERGFKDGDHCTESSIAKARNETLEEAASIAEEYEDVNTQDYYGEEIALAIRSLKSEGK